MTNKVREHLRNGQCIEKLCEAVCLEEKRSMFYPENDCAYTLFRAVDTVSCALNRKYRVKTHKSQ
jgi:hypothetical protein